jgi:biotin-(acetyl-CoA carboxylase) ligase
MPDPKIDQQLGNLYSNPLPDTEIHHNNHTLRDEVKAETTVGATFDLGLFNKTVDEFGPIPLRPHPIFLASTDSTMNEPKRYEDNHREVQAGTVFIAAEQTAGTGQDGRWHTGPSDIAMTIVLPDIQDLNIRAAFKFASGAAVVETLKNNLLHAPELAVKWPNDVFTKHEWQKVAGILSVSGYDAMQIEALNSRGYMLSRSNLSCGIGINLGNYINHIQGLRGTPTSVEALTGVLLSREKIAAEVACRVIVAHEQLSKNPNETISDFSKYLLTRSGGYIEMDLNPNEQTVKGTFEKISAIGLQFRHTDGQLDLLPLGLIKRIYPDSSIRRN